MEVRALRREEIESVYSSYMTLDFPRSELKPLSHILSALEQGYGFTLGFFGDINPQDDTVGAEPEGGGASWDAELVGYAVFIQSEHYLLLDYFAIRKDCRGTGLGHEALQKLGDYLREYFPTYRGIFIESEDITCAENEKDRKIRSRRIAFYTSCGCKKTDLKSTLFGVTYVILYLELRTAGEGAKEHTDERAPEYPWKHACVPAYPDESTDMQYNTIQALDEIYLRMFKPEHYETQVRLWKEEMPVCVIVGGAPISDYERIRSHFRKNAHGFVIYCDSGLKHRDALQLSPSLIVGDFDSYEKPQLDVETLVLPCEKDDTDTMFAVKEALDRNYKKFILLGMVGERLDHTLGNVGILSYLLEHGATGVMMDDYSEMELVTSNAKIGEEYAYFSLLAINGEARVSITGAKYPLSHANITGSYQYGISNEVLPGQVAEVRVESGSVLLVKIF